MDNYKLELLLKATAHHHRIAVLQQLKNKQDLSVEELAEVCNISYKTIATHVSKLANAGLVKKTNYGRRVEHRLTPQGIQIVELINEIR